jgi:hypothetical protein
MILFVLQNAYRSDKYNFKNEEEWSRDLTRCHSGKRLSEMIPNGEDYRVVNASPRIGDDANSKFPPDLEYLSNKIEEIKPDVIVACGVSANYALAKLGRKHVLAPHPAYRQLSKRMTKNIRGKIRKELKNEPTGCLQAN